MYKVTLLYNHIALIIISMGFIVASVSGQGSLSSNEREIGRMGIRVVPINPVALRYRDEIFVAEVTGVRDQSSAYWAGVQVGDRISVGETRTLDELSARVQSRADHATIDVDLAFETTPPKGREVMVTIMLDEAFPDRPWITHKLTHDYDDGHRSRSSYPGVYLNKKDQGELPKLARLTAAKRIAEDPCAALNIIRDINFEYTRSIRYWALGADFSDEARAACDAKQSGASEFEMIILGATRRSPLEAGYIDICKYNPQIDYQESFLLLQRQVIHYKFIVSEQLSEEITENPCLKEFIVSSILGRQFVAPSIVNLPQRQSGPPPAAPAKGRPPQRDDTDPSRRGGRGRAPRVAP